MTVGTITRQIPRHGPLLGLSATLGAGSLLLGWLAVSPESLRLALLASGVLLVAGVALVAPRATLYALVVWLVALGLVRRVLTGYVPGDGVDPLLLLQPIAVGALVVVAAMRGAFRDRTRLSNAVLLLSFLAVLGALNPLQGSFLAGAAGLVLFLVPMAAFWIGRGLCDDRTLGTVLTIVAGLGVLTAAYGLLQTFHGFPNWDANWIAAAQRDGYEALSVHAVGGHSTIRPFASFSSAAEYVLFLSVALIACLGFVRGHRRMLLVAGPAVVLGVAIVYGSSRGVIVAAVAALVLMLAASRRLPASTAVLLAVGGVLLLPILVASLAPSATGSRGAETLVAHQTQGLSDPFDTQSSTVGAHASLIVDGLASAVHDPLGVGVGAVSVASARFGGERRATEADPSNVAVALGVPGLLVFALVVFIAFRRAYAHASGSGRRLAIVALGLLVVTALQWLTGGHYAVAWLPWLALGWLDRGGRSQRDDDSHLRAG